MNKNSLYRKRVYTAKNSDVVLFYLCPFGTKFWAVRHNIKKLQRTGYNVVAYDTTNDVFYAADPQILIKIIDLVEADIKAEIARYKKAGINDFGFFATSLGAFIAYVCVSRIADLRWGVFNTGGDIAEAMWRIKTARRKHVRKGVAKKEVVNAWRHLQWPTFKNLDGHSYIFFSSPSDTIAPFEDIDQFIEPMRKQGANTEIIGVWAFGHISTAVRGFLKSKGLLRKARSSAKIKDKHGTTAPNTANSNAPASL